MKFLAAIFFAFSVLSNFASAYDLSSNQAVLLKDIAGPTNQISTLLSENQKAISNLPKLEKKNSLIPSEIMDLGDVKVSKEVLVKGEGTVLKTDAFNYTVNILIKYTFI